MINKLRRFAKECKDFGKIVFKRKITSRKGYSLRYNLKHINFIESSSSFITNHSTFESTRENIPYIVNNADYISINRFVEIEMDYDDDGNNINVRMNRNNDDEDYRGNYNYYSEEENDENSSDETSSNSSESDETNNNTNDDNESIILDVDVGTIPLNDMRNQTNISYDEFLTDDGTLLNTLFNNVNNGINDCESDEINDIINNIINDIILSNESN
jgi:hypothetical protein